MKQVSNILVLMCVILGSQTYARAGEVTTFATCQMGIAEVDITPELKPGENVYLAGYGYNRKATEVHDPIMARAMVLKHDGRKIALVSADLVGLQYPIVQRIRQKLSDFQFVLVSSTHNHEGPDVIGIWGETPFRRGVNPAYLRGLIPKLTDVVRQAEKNMAVSAANYGTATDASLLGDSRAPFVKDGTLRTIRFHDQQGKTNGVLVQWNCHPEAMGPKNTVITADFPAFTVQKLKEKFDCPVVYFSGAIGGLMAPPANRVHGKDGETLKEGDFEFAKQYGYAVADLAAEALQASKPIALTPFVVSTKAICIPVQNPLYRLARALGVVKRPGREWQENSEQLGPLIGHHNANKPTAVETEVSYLRLGQLDVACVPGELYPELVYGEFPNPIEPNSDFPNAPAEPTIKEILPSDKWLLLGMANDEIGYIIPKRQWDQKPPFNYGRRTAQYGEINSCSCEVAPIVMSSLARRVQEATAVVSAD